MSEAVKKIEISENAERNRSQLRGARVAVLGAARSGVAVSELLAKAGASVLLSDVQEKETLSVPEDALRRLGVELEFGGHSPAVLASDLICISPGLPLTIPVLQRAQQKGIPIVGELELASWFCQSPILAITGSNGKTTTTTLTGEIVKSWYPQSVVAGNIGKPFAELVTDTAPEGIAVLEVSSFQAETIVSFHPEITVFMNLTANHLDRYPDFESYARAKLNILKNMTAEDTIIFNRDDEYLSRILAGAAPRPLVFSLQPHREEGAYWEDEAVVVQLEGRQRRIALEEYHLRGPHNRYNMTVAVLIGTLLNIPPEIITMEVAQFRGIEHRLETVRNWNGITFVNDSKATTVDSLKYALQSFAEKIVLIAGGKDKGGDFSQLNSLIREKVRAVVLIGQAAARMENAWNGLVPLRKAANLKDAVHSASQLAEEGDVVLLSPACSSFDMFRDYEDRGRQFKSIVQELK